MWFKFPAGVERVSCQQQNFSTEAESESGDKLFRAPSHFAPILLAIPGFTTATPPDGAPEDIRDADPTHDNAVASLSAELASTKLALQNTTADLQACRAALQAANAERDGYKLDFERATAEISDFKDQIEELNEKIPETKKK